MSKYRSQYAIAAATLVLISQAADADVLFNFDTNFNDSLGSGAVATSLGGSLAGGFYTFAANRGLSVDWTPYNRADYGLSFRFSLSSVGVGRRWRKLLDFSDRSSDSGLYAFDGHLQVTDSPGTDGGPDEFHDGPGGTLLNHQITTVRLARNGQTKVVSAYLDDVLQFSYVDTLERIVFSTANKAFFFADDFFSGASEASSGRVDFLRINTQISVPSAAVLSGDAFVTNYPDASNPTVHGQVLFDGFSSTGAVQVTGNVDTHLPTTYLGSSAGSSGSLVIADGAKVAIGSVDYDNGGNPVTDSAVVVGVSGSGDFKVLGGAKVDGARYVGIAALPGSVGTLTVDGAGSQLNLSGHIAHDIVYPLYGGVGPQDLQGAMVVGAGGHGEANITDGGVVNITQVPGKPTTTAFGLGIAVGGGDVGDANGGTGVMNVSGAGSQGNITGENAHLWIGAAAADLSAGGEGTVNITHGGVVRLNGTASTFDFTAVGSLPGTRGTLLVDGVGSALVGGDVVAIAINATQTDGIEGNDIGAGSGAVTVRNGGRIESDFGVYVGEGGTLSGNGTVTGGLYGYGGSILPGNSPGDLTVIGNVALSHGADLWLEIAGPGVFDRILATGDFDLSGALVHFLFADGVDPQVLEGMNIGQFFPHLAFDGDANPAAGIVGETLLGLDSLRFVGVANGTNIRSITFDINNGFTVQTAPIPLPPTIVGFLSSCALLGWRNRLLRRHPARVNYVR